MDKQTFDSTKRPGLLVAIHLSGNDPNNPPPHQPDVDPLERENPDISEIEENQPSEQPEKGPDETPVPDREEIQPDTDREMDRNHPQEERDARRPM